MKQPRPPRRHGAVAPLTALLLIPVLGMVAFSVDIGYIAQTSMELQNAADAAALAAAEQLQPYYVQYYSPGADQSTVLSSAKTQATLFAKNYASFHSAGNASSIVLDTTNDLAFGYQDNSTSYTTSVPSGTFPNTVQVTLRLDGGTNTNPQLGLFFGSVLGMGKTTVTATARATIYTGTISNFSSPPSMLPVTLDQQIWNSFVQTGKGSLSDYSYTGTTSTAGSNLPSPAVSSAPQILVSPDPNDRPGGWNFLSLNSSSNSNSDYKSWFSSGLSSSDLSDLQSGGQLPLPSQPSDATKATYFWKGSPGDRGNSEPYPAVGTVTLLPLYIHVPKSQAGSTYTASDKNKGTWDGSGGVGQNSWFNIVQFVGVVVTDTSNGLSVQPAAVSSTSATMTNVQPAGNPGTGAIVTTTFAAPKLSY